MTNKEIQDTIISLYNSDYIPQDHKNYLKKISESFTPKVIYDIGACVLNWTKEAHKIWPDAKIYVFDGVDALELLYKQKGYEYNVGVLSDTNDKEVIFYQNYKSPEGSSYYKENSWATEIYYTKESEKLVKTQTVDTVVKNKNFQYPDIIKIDVQGCEIDILKGMTETLRYCKHLIVELQHDQYNTGAPLNTESIPFIKSLGFKIVEELFCNNGPDGDYHFKKI